MTTFKIGQQFHYTGDQANCPGIATIIKIKSSVYLGVVYSVKIKYDDGKIYLEKSLTASDLSRGLGERFIPLEEYQAEREKKIAELDTYMKNKPADFHSRCVKRQVINFSHPFIQ